MSAELSERVDPAELKRRLRQCDGNQPRRKEARRLCVGLVLLCVVEPITLELERTQLRNAAETGLQALLKARP